MHYLRWLKSGDPERVAFERATVQHTTCTVSGCDKAHLAKGYCTTHYRRLERTGSTELAPKPTAEDRFLAKVEKGANGCWTWQAERDGDGYGYFWDLDQRWRAHRWSYDHFTSAIPDGLQVDHLCSNRACVNPDHLEPVTAQENLRRSRER